MSQGLSGLLEQLISPPSGLLLLILAGLLLLRKSIRSGSVLISSGLLLLYVCSMPLTATWLLSLIESPTTISMEEFSAPRAEAIVILGAGRREDAAEFNLPQHSGDTLSASELERVRYGVWLAKRMKLPILVSGGLPDSDGPAEAVMMKQAIEEEYGIAVRWAESKSRNTYENAKFSAHVLKAEGIEKIYLVTHALHMPRSVWSFSQFELEIFPAPTAYKADSGEPITLKSFLPKASAMKKVAAVFHEVVGMVWYRLRY